MNSPFELDNPWITCYGDTDLLEDRYRQILDGVEDDVLAKKIVDEQQFIEQRVRMEARGLQETEEGAWLAEDLDEGMGFGESVSLRQMLDEVAEGSAVFVEARMWAMELAAWAEKTDPTGQGSQGAVVSAALHALVVPMKVRFGEDEDEEEDAYADTLARMEYRLARGFLKATLARLREASKVFPEAQAWYASGCVLGEHLLKACRLRQTHRSFRPRPL